MAGTPKHTPRQPLHELHHRQKGATDGGACITGHHVRYADNSCSYRWQAREISLLMRKPVYDGKVGTAPITTMAITDKNGEIFPPRYVEVLDPPQFGDWDLDGPRRTIRRGIDTIPPQKNFTKNRWPYWNDVHHLIPKTLFNDVISEMGKGDSADPEAPKKITTLLFQEKYNINHGSNTIILPQDKEVAAIMSLPRHLVLMERPAGAPAPSRVEMQSHRAYDDHVRAELFDIISEIKKRISTGTCDASPMEGSVDRLRRLSRHLYEMLAAFGAQAEGDPVADSPMITKQKPAREAM